MTDFRYQMSDLSQSPSLKRGQGIVTSPPRKFFVYDIFAKITRFLPFCHFYVHIRYIIFHLKTQKRKPPVCRYLSMKSVEKSDCRWQMADGRWQISDFRLQTSDSCPLTPDVSASHRNILESSSSVIFPIQLSPTETVMSARDLFFWMISLIFSSKVFLVMKRWTRTLFFWPMR